MARRSKRLLSQEKNAASSSENGSAAAPVCVVDVSSGEENGGGGGGSRDVSPRKRVSRSTPHASPHLLTPRSKQQPPPAASPASFDTEEESPVKLDSSLSKMLEEMTQHKRQLEADELTAGDDSVDVDLATSQEKNVRSIFVHHDTQFSYLPFDVDWEERDSLFNVFQEVSKKLDKPVSCLRFYIINKNVANVDGKGDSEEMVKIYPGKSLQDQGVSKDAVIFHCLDHQEEFGKADFYEDIDEKDRINLVIQRPVKRRAGMNMANLEKVSISFPRHEPLNCLLEYYCLKQQLSSACCVLQIDGAEIDLHKRAVELDLDDDDVIDCKILNAV